MLLTQTSKYDAFLRPGTLTSSCRSKQAAWRLASGQMLKYPTMVAADGLLQRISFCIARIFVSTYGSNSWGEGTPRLPFRDLSRAIQASLSRPRSYFIRKGGVRHSRILGGRQHRGVERRGSGLVRYINLDQIYLMDGIYRDRMGIYGPEQNLNLAAHGRVIEVCVCPYFHLL